MGLAVLNELSYHSAYSKLKNILSNINLFYQILTSGAYHRKVFPEASIVRFKIKISLKDLLVREKVPQKQQVDWKSCRESERAGLAN